MAAFNVVLLYALKADALAAINQANPSACPLIPSANASVQDCFDLVVSVNVPLGSFVEIFVVLFFAGFFGMYYDSVPSRSSTVKGVMLCAVVVLALVFGAPILGLGLYYFFDSSAAVATTAFILVLTPAFGYFLGRFYTRYTRLVSFESEDPSILKVVVDGREVTGRSRTFAVTSSHRLRAEVSEDGSFKEWEATGGVALEDLRSFETVMEVNGDGRLKGRATGKY